LDPDIEGRLQSLQSEHLAAMIDYMLGEHVTGDLRAPLSAVHLAGDRKTKARETVTGSPRA
jgi:hypothetical protein